MRVISSIFFILMYQISFAQDTLFATETEALLEVLVTNMKDEIRPHDKIVFEGKNTHLAFEGVSDVNGKFKILLPEGDIYQIKIQGLSTTIDFDEINIPKQDGKIRGKIGVKYRPAKKITLDDVHFETNKSTLLNSSFPALNDLIEILKIKPTLVLEIAGHTDNVGNDASNLKLSENRAKAVVNYLEKKGINTVRLIAKGYGENQPIASNDTQEGRRENRRTEARILQE